MQHRDPALIAGGGLAGLVLAKHLATQRKPFTLIEAEPKNTNDRTWCFWSTNPRRFTSAIYHQWNTFKIASYHYGEKIVELGDYMYSMVRSQSWYEEQKNTISRFSGAHLVQANIEAIDPESGTITTNRGEYRSNTLYSSLPPRIKRKPIYTYLKQSFLGWWIESSENIFDPSVATFMDFRTTQELGTTFVYVLPVSKNRALIEYTLFAEQVPSQEWFEKKLTQYIQDVLGTHEFTLQETEFGVLPMTDDPLYHRTGTVTYIGTPAAYLKPSSGFGFTRTHKKIDQLLNSLNTRSRLKFRLYDSSLLHALAGDIQFGSQFFTKLFATVSIHHIFRFLDEETNLLEDIALMIHMLEMAPYFLKRLPYLGRL